MKTFQRIVYLILCLALIFSISACSGTSSGTQTASSAASSSAASASASSSASTDTSADVTYFKLGHVNGTDSPQQKVAETMNKLLAEKMPQYQIEIYPSSQLGGERDMIEAVQLGSQDLVVTATTPLANFVPNLMVGELLYLIQDYDHADAVYQGDIGKSFLSDCDDAGMKGLGFSEVGFRDLCTNKAINSLADISGLKLRVMENQLHVDGWNTLGANAITMSWSDAYAGMQQGTIDAVEVPWSLIWANSVYDVAKYVAETNHIYTAQCFLMSQKAWNSMSADEQEIWQDCATEACKEAREYSRSLSDEFKQKCVDKGVTVTTPDLTEWRQQAENLYANYQSQYGDMISKIQALAK